MRSAWRVKAVLALALVACSASPAGFWRGHRPAEIVSEESHFGPHQGWLALHWQATRGPFDAAEVQRLAQEHGWRFEQRAELSAAALAGWTIAGEPVFPIHWAALENPAPEAAIRCFPRHIEGPAVLLTFDSRWMIAGFESGFHEDERAAGYVLISADEKQMAVYQLWGRW